MEQIAADVDSVTADLRFDGRVAIVTGAGRNLGRAYARLLAARGAQVVVNDIGIGISDTDGVATPPPVNPALAVVEEIRAAGGVAVLDANTITTVGGGNAIVTTALEAFGRVDIVINNAGVVRQAPIEDMADQLSRDMLDTHILGAMNVTRPAWRLMKAQGYGRVVNISSGSAFGIAGMAVYGAIKLAVVGLTRGQALEGAPHGIKVNVVAPYASVRGNDFGPIKWSPNLAEWLSPDQVAPMIAVLAHETCPVSGEWFTVGGGFVGRAAIAVSRGSADRPLNPEKLAGQWDRVMGSDADFRVEPAGGASATRAMFEGFVP